MLICVTTASFYVSGKVKQRKHIQQLTTTAYKQHNTFNKQTIMSISKQQYIHKQHAQTYIQQQTTHNDVVLLAADG